VSARLMAVADVYDALISKRVYKAAMTHEQALAIMSKGRGSHFDPDMLDAFLQCHEDFRTIARQYADEAE
jgi:putative two-component system response regulator